VVDLLLLDDGAQSPAPQMVSRTATAKGLYAELQRQLQEPNSHLKRKSALGALIGRGASARFIGHESLPLSNERGHILYDATSAQAGVTIQDKFVQMDLTGDCSTDEPFSTSASSTSSSKHGRGITRVPRILDFPQSRSHTSMIPLSGMDFVTSLFSWMSPCAPASCKSLEPSRIDTGTIVVAPPEMHGTCVPMPSKMSAKEDSLGRFEAGLGGWPLCVSYALAAFQHPAQSGSGSPGTSGALQGAPAHGSRFRRAALEVDDVELAVILAPAQGEHSCGSSGLAQTPSTASTMDSPTPTTVFAGAAAHSRVVFSREDITSVKQWPRLDAAFCASPQYQAAVDADSPCSYVVEVSGTPRGASQPLTALLALPRSVLASRLHDALSRVDRRVCRASAGGAREAVRCELEMNVNPALNSTGSEVNCAAVIRRGICEACHVGSERVWICRLRESVDPSSFEGQDACTGPRDVPHGAALEGVGFLVASPEEG